MGMQPRERNLGTVASATWRLVLCALLITCAGQAYAQSARPPKSRELIESGWNRHTAGDYENAAKDFSQAQANQKELTATERKDLEGRIQLNNDALKQRREGAALLRQAEVEARQAKIEEARAKVKILDINPHLTQEDKTRLERLRGELNSQPMQVPTVKTDARTLLQKGRDRLNCGDLEMAESLGREAEKCWPTWSLSWDNPSKLLRDVQNERTRMQRMQIKPTPTAVPAEKGFWLRPWKSMFRHKDVPEVRVDDKSSPMSPPSDAPKPMPMGTPGDGPPIPLPPPADPVSKPLPKTSGLGEDSTPPQKKSLFSWPLSKSDDGKELRGPGGITTRMSDQELPLPPSPPASASPPAIPSKTEKQNPIQQVSFRESPSEVPLAPSPRTEALRNLRDAQKALDMNDLDSARRFANQARDMKQHLRVSDGNPDRLLAEIQKREGGGRMASAPPQAELPAPPNMSNDPKAMVRLARELIAKERFDEAEKLIAQSAALRPKGWGLFEDSPDRLRTDLNKVRSRREREQADALMLEARKQFDAGNIEAAKRMAYQVQKLHGPYSVWDFGDRPQRLLDDIGRVEVTKKADGKPSQDHVANKTDPNAQRFVSTSNDPNRGRAIGLLMEARDLTAKGMLVEARQKALEAGQVNASFLPQEESPASVLANLNGLCGQRLNTMLQQSTDMLNAQLDPARFQKADGLLASAKGLCLAFGLDPTPIDERIQFVRQAQGGSPIAHQANKITSPDKLLGVEKLDKARLELRAGNTAGARRLAEDAFGYGVPEEATALLKSIDAEEYNQTILASNRTADAGVDAYRRHDYRRAASILGAVDMKRLAPERQRHVREILASAEMQPEALVNGNQPQTPGKTPPAFAAAAEKGTTGKAVATDLPGDNLMERARAMEKVQFDYFRERALNAQQTAMEHFKTDPARAIEVLQDYVKQLDGTHFDAVQTAALRNPVESRIAQYRTLVAQRDIEKQQKDAARAGHNEPLRNEKISKSQQEVAELIKRYRALHKEGKFEEALAEARKAKELDPDNLAADAAITMCSFHIEQKKWNTNKAKNEAYFNDALSNDTVNHVVDSKHPMAFDRDTLERHKTRESGKNGITTTTRSLKEKALERKLSEPVNLNFKDTELHQVITDLQTITGVSVQPDTEALEEAGVRLDQRLTFKADSMSLKSALNILLKKVHLTHTIENESITITTPQHAKGKPKQVVHNIADLVTPVQDAPLPSLNSLNDALARHIAGSGAHNGPSPYMPAMSLPQGQQVSSSQSQGLGSAFAQTNPGSTASTGTMQKPQTPQAMADILIQLITETVAPNTWASSGGEGRIQYFPLGMGLIINQTQEVQEDIVALLAALRRLQDLQVAVEMRLVSVSESFFERMGMDFDINLRTPTSRRETDLLNNAFTPFGFVNRNLDRMNMVSGLTPAGTLTPDLNIPIKNSSFDFSIPPFGGYPGTLGADGGISLGLAFLSDIQVFMFLEAAQGDRRTNVMQAPKITVFNGQTASINVQDQQFFLTNIQVQQAGAQLFFVPQQQPFPLGVSLQVTPVVSADRRFVRMFLQPQMTNLASTTVPLIPVQTVLPGQILEGPGGGSTVAGQPQVFQMFFQQPSFTQISITTTVNVPDGGTVLLGGLKTLSEGRNEHGPPILSKIPYLNRLFKNVAYGRDSQSLMIMVTPRIIINEEEELIFTGQLPPVPRP